MLPGRFLVALGVVTGAPLAGGTASPAMAQSGQLVMESPPEATFGETESVPIRIRNTQGEALELFASVGQLESVRQHDDWLEARYHLPTAGRHPQVAFLVAATSGFRRLTWQPINLNGAPLVHFTFEERSDVRVHVGPRVFGPVRTDRRGSGELRISVPPGVETVTATATDRLGNTRTQQIELSPDPFSRAFALCRPRSNTAWVFAVDSDGEADESAISAITTSEPSQTETRSDRTGASEITVRLDAPSQAEAIELVVRAGADGSASSQCSFDTTLPERMILDASSKLDDAGGTQVSIIHHYPPGALPRRATPLLTASVGTIEPPQEREASAYLAYWRLPPEHSEHATLTARTGDLVVQKAVSFEPPTPALSLAVGAGLVTNFGKVSGPMVQLRGAKLLELADHHMLALGASVYYWFGSSSTEDQNGSEQIDLSLHGASFLADVGYLFLLRPLAFHFRAMVGMALARWQLASPSLDPQEGLDASWALGVAGGGGFVLGPGRLWFETGFLYAPINSVISGNVAGLTVALGYEVLL